MQLDLSSLPVPCDRIIDGAWINDPYQHAFPVPQAGPEAATYLQAIAAGLCALLQSQAKSAYVSAFAYNLFSQNAYNNQYWQAVVSDCYDLATKIQTVNPTAGQNQVLETAIRKYHVYAVANCVNHFPVLQQLIPSNQINSAITATNAYRTEQQQLEVQYARMAQQVQGNSMLSLGSSIVPQNTPQQQSAIMGGGLGQFAGGVNILQDNSLPSNGWGSKRKSAAADSGFAPVAPVREARATVDSRVIDEPIKPLQTITPITIGNEGEINLMQTPTLTPRRRPRAAVHPDSIENDVVIAETQTAQNAARAPLATMVPAEQTSAHISMDDIDIGDPLPSGGLLDVKEAEAPVEKQQIMARSAPAQQPLIIGSSQYQAREVVMPLLLRILPDSLEEAQDAIAAKDQREGKERLYPAVLDAYPVGEADSDGKEPFGIFLTEESQLVTVVHAEDNGWAPSEAQQIRVSYNPLKWHRALVQRCNADNELYGPVVEGFIEIKDGDPMDYTDLELDPVLRAKHLAKLTAGQNYIPLKGELLEIQGVDRSLIPIGTHHSIEKREHLIIEAAREINTPKTAVFTAPRGKRKDAITTCVELANVLNNSETSYLSATMPASSAFRARHWDGGQRLTVEPKGRPSRYLPEQILELMPVVPSMAKQLDRLLATDVNEVLLYGFGYSAVDISSFIGDYPDLIDHLLGIYSEDTVHLFEVAVDDRLRRWSIVDDGKEIAVDGDAFAVVVNCSLEEMGVQLLSERLGTFTVSDCLNLVEIITRGKAPEGCDVVSPVLWFTANDGEIWKAHPSVFDPTLSLLVRQ